MPVVSDIESSVMPSSMNFSVISTSFATGIFPSKGQPKAVDIAPETAAPFSCAKAVHSLKPSSSSAMDFFMFARACDSLAERVSFTFVMPEASARSTPFLLATRQRYSTPGRRRIFFATSSVSAICGTAFGWTKEPTSMIGTPASAAPSMSAAFCSTESSVFSF